MLIFQRALQECTADEGGQRGKIRRLKSAVMKHFKPFLSVLAALGFVLPGSSAVLLDDQWIDGSRNEQNLPTESAWFASTASSLTAASGSMTGIGTTSSRLWLTYFTAGGAPATLGIGETLRATLTFTPTSVVTAPGTSRGLRIGLYNFSAAGATRLTADTFSTSGVGTNVPGYMLNMNFAQTFTIDNPLQHMERTDVANTNLMGSTSQYTSLGTGPSGVLNSPAFASGTQYTLEFDIIRTAADSVDVVTKFTGGSLNLAFTTSDTSGANLSFDALAIRLNNQNDAAASFNFSEFKVELLPIPEPGTLALAALGALGWIARKRMAR